MDVSAAPAIARIVTTPATYDAIQAQTEDKRVHAACEMVRSALSGGAAPRVLVFALALSAVVAALLSEPTWGVIRNAWHALRGSKHT